MNKGKICVPVCAKTVAEMSERIRRAEEFADIIELRLDCLDPSELSPESLSFESKAPFLYTYRPTNQGGGADNDPAKRISFWKALSKQSLFDNAWLDLETDLIADLDILTKSKIVSMHDFSGVPANLDVVFDGLAKNAEVVKIAVQTDDIGDSIDIWKLIELAANRNKKVIPIAMGEAGEWTRILGSAHGSFLSYASLEKGCETAPGQISAKDLTETYRAKELDRSTKIFGIIGNPVSQSMSPYMHNPAFTSRGMNAVFIPFLVKDLDIFVLRMLRRETSEVDLEFGGLSVTMPHKQVIMKYLDEIDETARSIGAVNTIKVDGDKLIGYNTDAHGFIAPLRKMFGDLKGANVALFGAGGAARACIYSLKNSGSDVILFARDPQKARPLGSEFGIELRPIPCSKDQRPNALLGGFDIVVDATPYGMGELEGKSLFKAEELAGVKFVYDLVTKPYDTPIIREAKQAGIPTLGGLEMLIAQGIEQFRIWTGEVPANDEMRGYVLSRFES